MSEAHVEPAADRRALSRRDRGLALVVPALLLAVALVQMWRVERFDQSPWSGAGFGMFAQIDGETTRAVRGWVDDGDGRRTVPLPAELERSAFELTVVPVESRARALAERWAAASGADPGSTFVVEVWRIRFEGGELSVRLVPMLRVEVSS